MRLHVSDRAGGRTAAFFGTAVASLRLRSAEDLSVSTTKSEGLPLSTTRAVWRVFGRGHDGSSAPAFSASGSGCCRSPDYVADRQGTDLSDAAGALDRRHHCGKP